MIKLNITNTKLEFVNRKSLQGLKYLDLKKNEILEISTDAFWDCLPLDSLILDLNKIKILDDNLLIYAQNLTNFSANFNRIMFIARDFFRSNLKLKEISLSDNQLVIIETEFFKIKNIKTVRLVNNVCIDTEIDMRLHNTTEVLHFYLKVADNCGPPKLIVDFCFMKLEYDSDNIVTIF